MREQADLIILDVEERMQQAVDSTVREFAGIRTGRANPSLLDKITVIYYGAETPLRQIASINVPEGNQLYIKPYDKTALKDIEHAIMASQLGITPMNDGEGIRLVIPMLTEERRRELVKDIEKLSEQGKVAIRNVRRDGNDQLKKLGLTEDDEKGYLDDVQKLTDKFVLLNEQETKIKSEELLKI